MIFFVRFDGAFYHFRIITCLMVLAVAAPEDSEAGEFPELAELVKSHENGIKKFCALSFKIVDEKAGTSLFYGGTDRCLSEYRSKNRVRVVCSTPEYLFELSQKEEGNTFFVEEMEFRDKVDSYSALAAPLANANFRLLSPFYFLDLPIVKFLGQKGCDRRSAGLFCKQKYLG